MLGGLRDSFPDMLKCGSLMCGRLKCAPLIIPLILLIAARTNPTAVCIGFVIAFLIAFHAAETVPFKLLNAPETADLIAFAAVLMAVLPMTP